MTSCANPDNQRHPRGRPPKGQGTAVPDFVLNLLEDTPKGMCIMCSERPAKRYTCGEPACRDEYVGAWQAENYLRKMAKRAKPAPLELEAASRPLEVQPGWCERHELTDCWLCLNYGAPMPQEESPRRHPDRLRFTEYTTLSRMEKRECREEGRRMLAQGLGVRDVARALRVSEDTVAQWKRQARRAAASQRKDASP